MQVPTPRRPGNMLDVMELSAFALEDGVVYHTYSTYDRGTEALNATWQLLDRMPMGRGANFAAGAQARRVRDRLIHRGGRAFKRSPRMTARHAR